ncbi:MAG: OsmC family protein [Saprospiraceae bacterium]|nr:OsmC family protein [Candidatus Brachybacter algidus]
MKINIKRLNDDYHMEAVNDNGNSLEMDGSPEIGGHNLGMRPMQLLLAAVGGCSAIDVIMILKKQRQIITSFEVEVDGENEKVEEHKIWKDINLHFKITGKVDEKKALNAVQLSMDKYCSVSMIMNPTANITYTVSVN